MVTYALTHLTFYYISLKSAVILTCGEWGMAPYSSSSLTHSTAELCTAKRRGLLEYSPAFTSAPCLSSSLRQLRLPLLAAQCNGVTFLLASHASTEAPLSIRSLTQSGLPEQAAR